MSNISRPSDLSTIERHLTSIRYMMPSKTAILDECINSMFDTMDSIKEEAIGGCSISFVPERVRKSRVEAYMPRVVCIGPLHRGAKRDLLFMEEIKWRCMVYLLHRNGTEYSKDILKICMTRISEAEDFVRACYNTDKINFNHSELAQIMVLDGCFLLELLICGSDLKNELRSTLDYSSPGDEIRVREEVLSDLTMLENQIPLFVLRVISTVIFKETFPVESRSMLIEKLALSMLGYSVPYPHQFGRRAHHLLDLVHLSIGYGEVQNTSNGKEKLKCITRLEAAGVTVQSTEHSPVVPDVIPAETALPGVGSHVVLNVTPAPNVTPAELPGTARARFDLKVRFLKNNDNNNNILEIPKLYINETTEAKWRNFIAWELNRATLKKQTTTNAERISCQFISYSWFFQGLICSIHDVKLLRERGVIVVKEVQIDGVRKKIMSDEELMNLLRNITEGVSGELNYMDSKLSNVIHDLNIYPTLHNSMPIYRITVNRISESMKIMRHLFRRFLTWIWYSCRRAFHGLERVYFPSGWRLIAVFAAAAVLTCTIIQTIYAVKSYVRDHK